MDEDLRHLVHSGGWDTEYEALMRVSPSLNAMKVRIFSALVRAGASGLTPDEYCEEIGGLINTVRRRFTDLWKEGIIRHHPDGISRPNAAGNFCVAWVIGCDAESTRRNRTILAMRNRIRFLEEEVARLSAEIERQRNRRGAKRSSETLSLFEEG